VIASLEFNAEALAAAGFSALGSRFLLWRTFPPRREGGKPVKSPCTRGGYPITAHDERGWLEFEAAATLATRRRLGLGIALGWGVGGLDIDRCRGTDGELSDMARRIVRHFPTYAEVSPSGTGIKLYFFAGPSFTTTAKVDAKGIELYAGRRFFALTGQPLGGDVVPIADCTAAARALASVLRPPRRALQAGTPAPVSGDALAKLRACGTLRERPSLHGGIVYTLRFCPFTGEAHRGGGPYAITFPDGAVHFRCDRSVHGSRAATLRHHSVRL